MGRKRGATYPKDAKLGDGALLGLDGVNESRDFARDLGRRESLKELAKLLLLVVIVGREAVTVS